jgi:hypothetical protein
MLVNVGAVIYQSLVIIDLIWPRASIYNYLGAPHWYFKWAAVLFIGLMYIIGFIYYFAVQVKKPIGVLAEHRADIPRVTAMEPIPAPLGDAAP